MERRTVDSKNIKTAGYDELTKTLEVEFVKGGIYQYFDVPAEVYTAFKDANSKGAFLFKNIKGKYKYNKLPSMGGNVRKTAEKDGNPLNTNVVEKMAPTIQKLANAEETIKNIHEKPPVDLKQTSTKPLEIHNQAFKDKVLDNKMFDDYDKNIINAHLSNFYCVFQLGWDAFKEEALHRMNAVTAADYAERIDDLKKRLVRIVKDEVGK